MTAGEGTGAPVVPVPSPTRKYPLAGIEPLRAVTPLGLAVPEAERYCTEVPERSTAWSVGLYSSTWSRDQVEAAAPPPPYTSEMTTFEASVAACDGGATAIGAAAVASATIMGRAGRTDIKAPRERAMTQPAYFLSRIGCDGETCRLTVRQPSSSGALGRVRD